MLHVGWASRDVTPQRPVLLRGLFHSRVSTHVNDPITVTALALERKKGDGPPEQAIMISCDLAAVEAHVQRRVREAVRKRLADFDPTRLFMNATHTHTGPTLTEGIFPTPEGDVMTPTEYADWFVEQAAETAAAAWQNRKPGGVSRAFGHAVVGHNRRAVYADGTARMYGKTDREDFECIEGYEDHSVDVLFLWDQQGRLTGVVVNLACPSQVTEGECYLSADFWHEAREELRRRLGSELHVLPQCAAAGDQSPHFLLYRDEEAYMRERRGVSERQEIGTRIADAVERCLETAKDDICTNLPFAHVVRRLELPARTLTEDDYAAAKQQYDELRSVNAEAEPERSRTFSQLRRARNVMRRYEAQETSPYYEMELHVLRLGDVAVATNPFELFLDYGLRIKARSKAPQTFIVQLTGGSGGYLPTRRAVSAKGYGACPADNRVGPEGGQELVERTLAAIQELWAES